MRVISSLVLIFSAAVVTGAKAECPVLELPTRFSANEDALSFSKTDMTLVGQDGEAGKINQRVLSWGKSFEILNAKGEKAGHTEQEVFSSTVKINVFDCEGKKIGAVHEVLTKSMFKGSARYSILDSAGHVVAQSDELDLFAVEIDMKDPAGRRIAEMKLPWAKGFAYKWEVTVLDSQAIHPLLLMVMPAYKTSADRERKN